MKKLNTDKFINDIMKSLPVWFGVWVSYKIIHAGWSDTFKYQYGEKLVIVSILCGIAGYLFMNRLMLKGYGLKESLK